LAPRFGGRFGRRSEEHGDDGYTGTIAEKFEYVLVAPTCPEKSIGLATWALNDGPANDDSSPDIPKHLQPIVAEIASLIADKWGPAVALQLTDEETRDHLPLGEDKLFLFFGWAPY
jgi:hypothetical protein